MDIFSIQHPLGGEAEYACGKIIKIFNNFEFEHTVDTDHGSSGSPIILNESLKVIGIHKQSNTLNNNNIGTFIGEIFKEKDKKEIFKSEEFNDLSPDEFYYKYKNHSQIEELMFLKKIHQELLDKCKLRKSLLDAKGNKIYDPPLGWIGFGLRVLSLYEDNIWIGKNNNPNEWCVAYLGVGRYTNTDLELVYSNSNSCFGIGPAQIQGECPDRFHSGFKVGQEVYLSPNIKYAELCAGEVNLNNKIFKTVLMSRVKNSKIRSCSCSKYGYNYVVNAKTDEVRPYRILLKMESKC